MLRELTSSLSRQDESNRGRFNLEGRMRGPNEILIFMPAVALAMFVTLKMQPHQVAELVEVSNK